MPSTKFQQKVILIVLGLLISLIILEVSLRCAGWTYVYFQEKRNQESIKNKGSYRILCLGESTTAMGGENSYPRQLENVLNRKSDQIRFSVINKGLPATVTSAILANAEMNIFVYKPDLLITMMGVNDIIYGEGDLISNDASFKHKVKSFAYSLRVVKLLGYLYEGIENRLVTKTDVKKVESEYELKGRENSRQGKLFLLSRKLVDTGINKRSEQRWEDSEGALIEAIGMNPSNISAYMELIETFKQQEKFRPIEDVYKKAITSNQDNPWGYAGLSKYYRDAGRDQLAKEYAQKAESLRLQYLSTTIKENYLKLKKITDEQLIPLMIVQYPLLSIEPLKKIFNDQKGILYVENRSNFQAAIETKGFDVLFNDSFAGEFGHATKEGNRLLAENVAAVILKHLGVSQNEI